MIECIKMKLSNCLPKKIKKEMKHVLLLKLSIKINYNESQINIAKFLTTKENKKVPAPLQVIKASLYC